MRLIGGDPTKIRLVERVEPAQIFLFDVLDKGAKRSVGSRLSTLSPVYSDAMATVECPIEGCGYRDNLASVEAHVSGSTNNSHSGHSGWNFREQLREQIEEELSEVEAPAETSTESAAAGLLAATVALAIIVVVSG